jgi:hypothetical protein
MKLRKSDVATLIAASFPNYRGRLFTGRVATDVCFGDLNWSGGSRSQYVILDLATGRRADLRQLSRNAPWSQPMEGATVPIPAGMVVVEHTISAGNDRGLTFHHNPADRLERGASVPALPAARVEGS